MASVKTITEKCADFLIRELHSGQFDQAMLDIIEEEMTGEESDNREYVEEVFGDVYL